MANKKIKKKFYVVWVGRRSGIYQSWPECQIQTDKFFGAKFKGFPTNEEAIIAFKEGPTKYWGQNKKVSKKIISQEEIKKIGSPILESISVDGAWDTSTGLAEYQGVATDDKTILFHQGPFEDGTNNIVEFLAIVHALSYCKKNNIEIPIYSDSKIAIGWVKSKHHRSNLIPSQKNKKIFELLDRAEKWLAQNSHHNKILKWETRAWGENPADFGRK
jgi:ribonuclease HI